MDKRKRAGVLVTAVQATATDGLGSAFEERAPANADRKDGILTVMMMSFFKASR